MEIKIQKFMEENKESEAQYTGKNSIARAVEEALKDSGNKALERHAANGRPIVITVNGVIMNKYIDGRIEERKLSSGA